MRFFRQLAISYLALLSLIHINGKCLDENISQELHRTKRSTLSCNSVPSLKKYTYVSTHTACISPSVNLDSTSVGVTTAEQTEIVDEHNNYRASESAADMIKMSWDAEAAYIAQKWAENCLFSHDSGYNRRIPGRFSLGQNLAQSSSKFNWTSVTSWWYKEIKDFTYNGSNVLSSVGHYTQVVWSKSIKIGCGYAKCGTNHIYVCNYGPAGNFNINIPFKQGTKCDDCPGHCDNNICSCGGLICLNGGTLNLATCTCSCINGYSGTDCSLNCGTKTDPSGCLSSYTVTKCSQFSNVPEECPHMCSFCPNAGIAVTGASDGMGGVPFSLTGSGGGASECYRSNTVVVIGAIALVLLYI